MKPWIKEAHAYIAQKTKRNLTQIGAQFPHATKNGRYDVCEPQWWTAGFWPGILWNAYLDTNEEEYKTLATTLEKEMDVLLTNPNTVDHDIGFMWTLTSLARYEITGDQDACQTALQAANMLLARYNSLGHYFKAWNNWHGTDDNSGIVIIDSMMNMGLLFWASEETRDPRFKIAAMGHSDMILQEFVRPDGSVHQMVDFDSATGEVKEKRGGQGFAEDSSWSRGCGWAIYGLAIAYHYTKEDRYLEGAMKVCNHFALHLGADALPLWDFRIPENTETIKYDYRDSSASAVAACGALLIGKYAQHHEGNFYAAFGEELLHRLYESSAATTTTDFEGLLKDGTSHWPEQKYLHEALIYGDYFFTEGIYALSGIDNTFWLGKKLTANSSNPEESLGAVR